MCMRSELVCVYGCMCGTINIIDKRNKSFEMNCKLFDFSTENMSSEIKTGGARKVWRENGIFCAKN